MKNAAIIAGLAAPASVSVPGQKLAERSFALGETDLVRSALNQALGVLP